MTLPRAFAICCIGLATISFLHGQSAPASGGGSVQALDYRSSPDSQPADSSSTELVIPNVFTPNDDEINDYFEVETDGITVYEFTVFTRTGSRIYRSNSPRIFWDGRSSSGLPVKEGVYYFVIEAEGDPSSERTGFIYLYR